VSRSARIRRYPESYRALALQGAEIILIGYNTPISALALDLNELCMRAGGATRTSASWSASPRPGSRDGVELIAGSCIIDPQGQVLAKAATRGDELIVARIDCRADGAAAQALELPRRRQPQHYGEMLKPVTEKEPAPMSASVLTSSFGVVASSPAPISSRRRWRSVATRFVASGPDSLLPKADRVIDASGKLVLPGLIDAPAHRPGIRRLALRRARRGRTGLDDAPAVRHLRAGETLPIERRTRRGSC